MFTTSLASAEVSITVDTLSNQKNYVEFTVTNIGEDTHVKYIGVHVEKKEKGKWKIVRWHLVCPCNAKCKKAMVELGVNESSKYVWDKKDSSCNAFSKGIYRFKITGEWNDKTNKIDIIGKSSEFTLP